MIINISDEKIKEILDWAEFNYQTELEALAFFDPSSVTIDYPNEDVNMLLVLKDMAEGSRERYQLLSDGVLGVILGLEQSVQCRIQTPEELEMLAELHLPLLSIYLTDGVIVYDPNNLLTSLYKQL